MNYKTFHDMLNSYRIKYVLDELRKYPNIKIDSLYYQAGYSSNLTAKRNFIAYTGCSYDEFIKKLTCQQE